ncbi:hypothetical protein BDV19DRAFT_187309 [Aspergillus venezuelensis]
MGIAGQGRQGREGLVRRLRARPRPGPARTSLPASRNRAREGRGVGMGEPEHHGPDYFSCGGRKVKSAVTQKAQSAIAHACRQQEGRRIGDSRSARAGQQQQGREQAGLWSRSLGQEEPLWLVVGATELELLGSLVGIGNASHVQHGATEGGQNDLFVSLGTLSALPVARQSPRPILATALDPLESCSWKWGGVGCNLSRSRELARESGGFLRLWRRLTRVPSVSDFCGLALF